MHLRLGFRYSYLIRGFPVIVASKLCSFRVVTSTTESHLLSQFYFLSLEAYLSLSHKAVVLSNAREGRNLFSLRLWAGSFLGVVLLLLRFDDFGRV